MKSTVFGAGYLGATCANVIATTELAKKWWLVDI